MRRLIQSIGKSQQVSDATPKQQRRLPRVKLFLSAIALIAATITTGYGVVERDQLTRPQKTGGLGAGIGIGNWADKGDHGADASRNPRPTSSPRDAKGAFRRCSKSTEALH